MKITLFILAVALSLAGCVDSADSVQNEVFSGISEEETIHLVGAEPFWNAEIGNGEALYSTLENQNGTRFKVDRFAGLNGVSFSGKIGDAGFDAMITSGECSDGMSDRTYPYTATLKVEGKQRTGCGYTDSQLFSGSQEP